MAIHRHPVVALVTLRLGESIDDDAGHATVVGPTGPALPERHDLPGRRPSVPEHKVGHDQVLSGHAKIGLTRKNYASWRLRCERNGLAGPAFAREQDLEITPLPVSKDNAVACLAATDRFCKVSRRPDKSIFRHDFDGRAQHQDACREGGHVPNDHVSSWSLSALSAQKLSEATLPSTGWLVQSRKLDRQKDELQVKPCEAGAARSPHHG